MHAVNRLGGLSLPRKSVVRLTDRPDMTLDVYRGRKTTKQQQRQTGVDFAIHSSNITIHTSSYIVDFKVISIKEDPGSDITYFRIHCLFSTRHRSVLIMHSSYFLLHNTYLTGNTSQFILQTTLFTLRSLYFIFHASKRIHHKSYFTLHTPQFLLYNSS